MRLQMVTAAAFALLAGAASATTIVAGSDWQYDQVNSSNAASLSSPWTFTVASGEAVFRVTDGFTAGDLYQLFNGGTLVATSTYYAGAALASANPYFFEDAFQSVSYSKIEYLVGPGSYSFNIFGNGAAGFPAGFGVRLDTVVATPTTTVPDVATWSLMLVGFGMIGGSMRRRSMPVVSA
jgi:hypothetical protein